MFTNSEGRVVRILKRTPAMNILRFGHKVIG